MSLRHEIGLCRAFLRGDGGSFALHPDAYAGLLAAWRAGQAFHECQDLHGATIWIKLGEVCAVSLSLPDAIARCDEDMRADSLAT